MLNVLDTTTIVVFLLLGLTLLAVGFALLMRIKRNYPGLHREHGCLLWLALILLSVPLCTRAVVDYSLNKWNPGTDFTLALYNMTLFLIADYLPIIFQIGSLVFGFIRRKQVALQKGKFKPLKDEEYEDGTEDDDDSTVASEAVFLNSQSFFEPPVENFHFVY